MKRQTTHTSYDFGATPAFLLFGQKKVRTACGKAVAPSTIDNATPECQKCRDAIAIEHAERQLIAEILAERQLRQAA